MRRSKVIATSFISSLVTVAANAAPSSLSDLEKLQQYQKAIDATNRLEAMVDQMARERSIACEKAFGHASFCKCLTENLPYGFSFNDYIAITTQTREQNGYVKLGKKMREAYDRVPSIRDQCVRQ